MPGRIHLSAPDVRDLERQYVLEAIDSGWLAPAGPALSRFEAQLAIATERQHAVALSSGTAALHLALLGVGVQPGDEVVCSTFTFIGSVAPITYCGARPVFVDSESSTWNMDPSLLEELLVSRSASNTLPAAVVVVDLYGLCADYDSIIDVCARFDVPLVEDAAEALGAAHPLGPAGSFGAVGVLSFNGNKMVTTSGGGALVTDDAQMAERARFLSSQAREPVAHYEHVEVGFNYRLSNILAALGSAQLERLAERVERRSHFFEEYQRVAADVDGATMLAPPDGWTSNHWLSCLCLESPCSVTPTELLAAFEAADIEARPAWKPMHLQPVFATAPAFLNGVSEAVFRSAVCLPSGSGMTDAEFERVLAALIDVLG